MFLLGRAPADALGDVSECDAFEQHFAARVRTAYPMRVDGKTLLPLRRLFIVAAAH